MKRASNSMRTIVIRGGTLIAPDRLLTDAELVLRDGKILSVNGDNSTRRRSSKKVQDTAERTEPAEIVNAQGGYICPGFVDLHVHGGAGFDFMDGTAEAVRTACQAHLQRGTTTIFPTTTTGSAEQIEAMLEACQEVQGEPHSTIAGVHLYGPFFAADKVGCHSPSGRRPPVASEYRRYFARQIVAIATCAAELPGADKFYRAAARAGCFITCGHSNANWTEMQRAFDLGMRHVDHFWCAMSSVPSLRQRFGVPMQASMAEFVLMNPAMSTEVIADGWHLSDELLEFAYHMLGPERLCLVTDCNRGLGLPPGEYRFGNAMDGTWFYSDGQVGWSPDRSSLASSIVGMDHMVRSMHDRTSASLPEVVRMASLTPAERVGIAEHVGSLEVGKMADVLILDKKLRVQRIFLRGREWGSKV